MFSISNPFLYVVPIVIVPFKDFPEVRGAEHPVEAGRELSRAAVEERRCRGLAHHHGKRVSSVLPRAGVEHALPLAVDLADGRYLASRHLLVEETKKGLTVYNSAVRTRRCRHRQ